MMASNAKRFLWSAAAIASVGAAGIVMAAPASAAVAKVEITTPSGYGLVMNRYGTGCSYDVAATVDDYSATADNVTITVARNGGSSQTLIDEKPKAGTVTATWKPSARGSYTITATQGGVSKTTTAQVGTGIQLPSFILGGGCLITNP
ncbi:hypothetical protein [Gordonia hankookensis]|uniref:Uncharacterized protein n=1 Tax=Gordonia hankookensis TaxID=589403 RepID=A0ABR7W568_9ACTN|nr:hypothetical protein [Gordonia hankookensis]MBD1317979.1 hypothetical protein [Gordonia hankookensis]